MLFVIPGDPQGKKRPRYSRKNGVVYTPTETVKYEKHVAEYYIMQGGKRLPDQKDIKGANGTKYLVPQAYKVEIWAFLKPPKSVPKWTRALMDGNFMQPTKKPDIDNVGKIILDGLNGIAWHDDSAVTELTIHKRYDQAPRVEVEIKEI